MNLPCLHRYMNQQAVILGICAGVIIAALAITAYLIDWVPALTWLWGFAA